MKNEKEAMKDIEVYPELLLLINSNS